jgi:hypothetical protein
LVAAYLPMAWLGGWIGRRVVGAGEGRSLRAA